MWYPILVFQIVLTCLKQPSIMEFCFTTQNIIKIMLRYNFEYWCIICYYAAVFILWIYLIINCQPHIVLVIRINWIYWIIFQILKSQITVEPFFGVLSFRSQILVLLIYVDSLSNLHRKVYNKKLVLCNRRRNKILVVTNTGNYCQTVLKC